MDKNYVYLAIKNDKFELPIALFENIKQLAKYAEVSYKHACCMVSRKSVNRKLNCYFIKVFIGGCE